MLCACSSHGSVRLLLAGLAAVLLVLAAPARSRAEGPDAIQYLAGCSDSQLARNDDGSTGRVGLGFTLDFLGTTYDGVYVNNNGNVTFDSPLSTYTPFPLSATSRVIVAPFFGDVDTRAAASNVVTFGQTVTLDGHKAFCVDWAGVSGVGYYNEHTDKLNSFQLLLIDRSDVGAGDFDIEMNYDKVQWETGDASGGSGGLGGSSARMGWSNGDPASSYEHPGSGVNGAFLDSSPTGLVHGSRDSGHLGRYVFAVRGGRVIQGGGIRPVIVVPGTTGTYLRNPGGEVWPNVGKMLEPGDDSYLDALQLGDQGYPDSSDDNHKISIGTGSGLNGVIGKVQLCAKVGWPCATLGNHYNETVDQLESLGYHYDSSPDASTTIFMFPYDWRLSSAYNGGLLRDRIAEVKRITGADTVDILAHSQGGLVVNAALREGAAPSVHRVVTLGTPFLGTPKFLDVLEYAQPCLADFFHHCWLSKAEVQKLVRNFAGSNELLPSRRYYDLISNWPIYLRTDTGGAFLNFVVTSAKLASDGHANPFMLGNAQGFHDTWDTWPASIGVPILRIAGTKLPTLKTAVEVFRTRRVYSGGTWHTETVHSVSFTPGSGDGTVVYPSAELVNCERGIAYTDAAAHSYASFRQRVSHDDLAHDPWVISAAVGFLRDGRVPTEACPGHIGTFVHTTRTAASDETAGLDATMVSATGPLSGTLADGSGAFTGDVTGDGDPAEEIPGSAYFAGDGGSALAVSGDGVFAGTWTATGDGEAQLQVRVFEDELLVGTAVSPTVDVHQGAVLRATVSRPGPLDGLQLTVDDNGDGSVDRTIPFGPALAGDAAGDLTPPTSTVDVQHYTAPDGTRMAHVTVTAADEGGAGVAEIRYTLNAAGPSGVYTGPLDLPAKGEIAVTAVDAAGNVQARPAMGVLDDHSSLPELVSDFAAPHLNDTGWIDYVDDVDYWGIDAAGGRLQAQLVGLDADYDLAVCDASGNVLGASESRGNRSEKVVLDLPAGHYLVRVRGYGGAWDDRRPYRINVTGLGG